MNSTTEAKAAHTPGPWEYSQVWHTVFSGNKDICQISAGFGRAEEAANARLIASAPQLVAALEGMASRFAQFDPGDNDGNSDCPELVAARAALAAAKEVQG